MFVQMCPDLKLHIVKTFLNKFNTEVPFSLDSLKQEIIDNAEPR